MTPEEAFQTVKDAVDKHEADGPVQWYVDELTIDCDAEEFWKVVAKALEVSDGTGAIRP